MTSSKHYTESLLISAGDFSQYCYVLKHNIDKVDSAEES